MVLGWFLGNALADMHAKRGECEAINTSSVCFSGDTNIGRIAERLGWVPLQPLPKPLQLYLLEVCPMLESIQKYLWPRLCKLDQWTLYEQCYRLITFGKILKDDTTLDAADIDNSGTIDYGEFLAAIEHLNKLMTSQISVEVVHDLSGRSVHTTSGVGRFVGRNRSPRQLTMLQNEGIKAFHKGLSTGLLRQATYTTARLGSFKVLTNKVVSANDGKPLPLYQKAICGVTAGAIGVTVGSPADSSLIRMQADATLPDFLGFGEASTTVGPSAKMQPDASGKYPYTSSLDCAMKTLKFGGPLKFHTGFPVHCVRIAPYVMLTWIFLLEPNPEVGGIHGVVNLINARKC
ncbi:hypothetical protein PVL29_027136 [Vitis rotundifolia]|uniref:EF-hand domain-containing protein n=1 Tax=Vitis rotundifolia TaxID=103349 RepID=A0AA38YIC2_VITRO|nr:hypothetical protein PVL29_027136 [Vitis rotundifolia]